MLTACYLHLSFSQLGSPVWAARDAADRRCDCLLGAVLAPVGHSYPEVRLRAERIRDRWLGRWLPLLAEAVRFGRAEADPDGLMAEIQAGVVARDRFLLVRPLPPGLSLAHLTAPLVPGDAGQMRLHLGFDRLLAAGGGVAWPKW